MKPVMGGCAVALSMLAAAGAAHAQVASAVIHEGDVVDGLTVTAVSNSGQNGLGGYAFTLSANDALGEAISLIWGNYMGGANGALQVEGTFGDLVQTSFESFFGLGNSSVGYSATSNRISDGATGLDGAWMDNLIIQNEEDPVGARFSTFNSRVGITHDNQLYWVGGLSDTLGGATQDRALFFNGSIVFQSGDVVAGLGTASPGSSVDFDFRFSELGANWLSPIDFDTGSTTNDMALVMNGNAVMAGGGFVREGDAVAASIGGLVGEAWSNFDFMGVNEAGDIFFTGDTNAAISQDEFVFQNGQIVLREGDMVGGNVISGSIEGGYQNGSGDWGVIWDVDTVAGNVEALIVNGQSILLEGDAVDWDNSGAIDAGDQGAVIDNFTGISALTLGERDEFGFFNVAFTADVMLGDGSIVEGGFILTIPAPASAALFALGACSGLRRRR